MQPPGLAVNNIKRFWRKCLKYYSLLNWRRIIAELPHHIHLQFQYYKMVFLILTIKEKEKKFICLYDICAVPDLAAFISLCIPNTLVLWRRCSGGHQPGEELVAATRRSAAARDLVQEVTEPEPAQSPPITLMIGPQRLATPHAAWSVRARPQPRHSPPSANLAASHVPDFTTIHTGI